MDKEQAQQIVGIYMDNWEECGVILAEGKSVITFPTVKADRHAGDIPVFTGKSDRAYRFHGGDLRALRKALRATGLKPVRTKEVDPVSETRPALSDADQELLDSHYG